MDGPADNPRVRLLIEDWLPIQALGIESLRERTPMTPYPAPNRLHVWFARRPLVASRAAILASLLPSTANRQKFLHMLGIHGDPAAAKLRIAEATRKGERLGKDAYGYPRAFQYVPAEDELGWFSRESLRAQLASLTVADVTAGGGSIPFEALRLGARVTANDLNPVAWLVLKATVELPQKWGLALKRRFQELGRLLVSRIRDRLDNFYPPEPQPNCIPDGYLWARTIKCPYCGGKVPLSPNWKLDGKGKGVRLIPHTDDPANRHVSFEIVGKAKDHSPGTIKDGDATCPFPDCGRFVSGDEVKKQAQTGQMGHQLYTVVYKQNQVIGFTKGKNPKPKIKQTREYRTPRPEDDVEAQVRAALAVKMPDWECRDIVPTEQIDDLSNYDRGHRLYGVSNWRDMFAPRQLFGHGTSVELFRDLYEQLLQQHAGDLSELDRAALTYIAIAIDKVLSYNTASSRWDTVREAVRGIFDRHNFAFQWSYGEMAPTVAGLGYDWAIEQTGKALEELIELGGHDGTVNGMFAPEASSSGSLRLFCESADELSLEPGSVDCIVMDPPYYDNVMYAELSDFFYVWLKRTAGLLYPEAFGLPLTDKDREAIANPARFKGQKGAKELACRDYEDRMARIFEKCRQVLKSNGVMTVMFTHKSASAWDALASGIVRAGFVITASWPVNTEAEGSLHIKEKSAAKSTIFLVCRPRGESAPDAETVYWEDVEPKVVEKVRQRVGEFQAAGIRGVDLYLACFGPALQVFSEHWPLKRGRAVQHLNGTGRNGKHTAAPADPYAVRPEDALDAARREVKRWRLEQLATVRRQHHLDPLTEWYVLAWDTFKAPRFSADEALRLARVVGLDFDRQVKNVVCEAKGEDVSLWDSKTRQAKGKLGQLGGPSMLDTLHHAALIAREQNTGAAQAVIQEAGLLDDQTLLTALEVLLNVLPPPAAARRGKKADALLGGAASDFEALENLRRLAFAEKVPAPTQADLFEGSGEAGEAGESESAGQEE